MSTDRQREAAIALARAAFQFGASATGTQPERHAAQAVDKWAATLNIGPDELLVLFCAQDILRRKDNDTRAINPLRANLERG